MSDHIEQLVAAAETGSAADIAHAAAAVATAVWLTREDGWLPLTPGSPAAPTDAAVVVGERPHRIALVADEAVVGLVRVGLSRVAADVGRRAAESRLDLNERIAGIGSYDWHIDEDVNDWSDELFRIYGHEPGAFNASYEKFMELVHPDDRERIRDVHAAAYATGEPYEMEEHIVRPDGSVRTLWSNGAVIRDEDGTPRRMVGVCRDITDQRAAEQRASEQQARILEGELLRKQALELNDNVVQGLTAVAWAVDDDAPAVARAIATETLEHARRMMHRLRVAADGTVTHGSLVRREAARMALEVPRRDPAASESSHRCRLVLADDAEDLRYMLRLRLESEDAIEVVGEAGDGIEAVEVVSRTSPDAILLDLSMPRMDGLEACARIREQHPDIRIVILSGWASATMGADAHAAGADAYVEKGASVREILSVVLGELETAA